MKYKNPKTIYDCTRREEAEGFINKDLERINKRFDEFLKGDYDGPEFNSPEINMNLCFNHLKHNLIKYYDLPPEPGTQLDLFP